MYRSVRLYHALVDAAGLVRTYGRRRYKGGRFLAFTLLHGRNVRIRKSTIKDTGNADHVIGRREALLVGGTVFLEKSVFLAPGHAALVSHTGIGDKVVEIGVAAAKTVPSNDVLEKKGKGLRDL